MTAPASAELARLVPARSGRCTIAGHAFAGTSPSPDIVKKETTVFTSYRRLAGGAMLAIALPLTACSSSTSSTTSSAGSATAAGAAATQSCVSQATKLVDATRQPLAVKPPPSPIDMAKNAGKSVWLISASQDEFTQTVASGFLAAAKAAGMTGRYVQANGQVNQMDQLVQEAVSAHANGIALLNIEPSTVSGPLAAARAAKTTVIDLNNGNPTDPLQPGIFAHVADQFSTQGKLTGDWMLMNSGCHVHVATFSIPTLPVVVDMIQSAISEINRLCPTSCTVNQNTFEYATFATGLGPQAQTVVRRNPSINYIDPGADAFASVISPVLQQTGSHVAITGHDGSTSNLKAMAAHTTLQAMTIANPPEQYTGWAVVDQLGRGMLGDQPADWALPGRIIDSTNIGDGSSSAIYPGFQTFTGLFLKAWGLQG
jgi:ABC-type sugar transport system substrate-binding protein